MGVYGDETSYPGMISFFFGALRLAAFFFGALPLAAFFFGALRLAAFFFGALRLDAFRFVALRADDFLVLVVRAAVIVFFPGSVSCVASGSSAEVVFSDIANLVLKEDEPTIIIPTEQPLLFVSLPWLEPRRLGSSRANFLLREIRTRKSS